MKNIYVFKNMSLLTNSENQNLTNILLKDKKKAYW